MTRYILTILIVLATSPMFAQGIDFDAILQANRQASEERDARQSTSLDGIASAMREESVRNQRELSASIGSVASAMRAESANYNQNGGNFYSADINYSTFGSDARSDIAKSATGTAYTNPYVMGEYAAATYARPGGSRYLNLNYGPPQQRPVKGGITSDYGYRPSFGRMHRGVDLALRTGDTVRAAFPGKVVLVGNDPKGYGRYVKVSHDGGIETIYAHLSAPSVVHGQSVAAGQPVGLGGATGNATGPHLHFETRVNGIAVNPSNYFNFGKGGGTKRPVTPLDDNGKRNSVTNDRKAQPAPAKPKIKTRTVASAQPATQPRTASYKVRRGETLEKIARDHGMSVGEICRLNKMSKFTPMYTGKVIRLK